MSYLLDAYILIYAFREEAPEHSRAYQWLTQALEQQQPLWTTAANEIALLRMTTQARLGPLAASVQKVFEFLEALHIFPNYQHAELGKAGLMRWQALTLQLGLSGNDLNDAYLAALALERHLTLMTADQGFERFRASGLKLEYLS